MKKDTDTAPTLFDKDELEIGLPIFAHSYIKPCTFLGTFNGKDLYHSILGDGEPMLIERYSSEPFKFTGEGAAVVNRCYAMDDESPLGEAYRRAKKMKLKL